MRKENKLIKEDKIRKELNNLRKSIMNLRFQKTTGQLEKTSEIKKNKKKIAQLLTQINQYKESKNA
jgi:ribosomal protein L29